MQRNTMPKVSLQPATDKVIRHNLKKRKYLYPSEPTLFFSFRILPAEPRRNKKAPV